MATVGKDVLRDRQATIQQQATWGTAIDTAPLILPTGDLEITQEPGNITVDALTGSRTPSDVHAFNYSTVKPGKVTFSCPLTPQIATLFGFPAIFQKNVAWTGTTFTYTNLEQASLPSPVADTDAGYFYTICDRSPNANDSTRLINCVGTAFELSIHPDENNGLWHLKTEWIGEGYTEIAALAQVAATSALSVAAAPKWIDLDICTIGGNAMITSFYSAKITYTYGCHRQGDTVRGDLVFPKFEAKAEITVFSNTSTDELSVLTRTSAVSTGIAVLLRDGDGTVSTAGEYNFDMFGLLRKATPTYIGDSKAWTFELEGLQGGVAEYPFSPVIFYSA